MMKRWAQMLFCLIWVAFIFHFSSQDSITLGVLTSGNESQISIKAEHRYLMGLYEIFLFCVHYLAISSSVVPGFSLSSTQFHFRASTSENDWEMNISPTACVFFSSLTSVPCLVPFVRFLRFFFFHVPPWGQFTCLCFTRSCVTSFFLLLLFFFFLFCFFFASPSVGNFQTFAFCHAELENVKTNWSSKCAKKWWAECPTRFWRKVRKRHGRFLSPHSVT